MYSIEFMQRVIRLVHAVNSPEVAVRALHRPYAATVYLWLGGDPAEESSGNNSCHVSELPGRGTRVLSVLSDEGTDRTAFY